MTDVYLKRGDDRMVVFMDRPVSDSEKRVVKKLTGWEVVTQGGHCRSFAELVKNGYTGRLGPGEPTKDETSTMPG